MEKEATIPAWGGNYSPFRLIARETDVWSVTVDEANTRSYDNTKLFRASLNVDVGIAPYSLIILFDGTLVVPRCQDISKSKALSIFNRHLTDLLLGGLFSREIPPDDVTAGEMNLWGYHRHHCPKGPRAKLSHSLRARRADPDDAIRLVGFEPLSTKAYLRHYVLGSKVSRLLPTNFASVFLPSCTGFCSEEWERALILGWSSIELLISQLWDHHLISSTTVDGIKAKRRKDFLSDTRTWTSSTRIELLWHKSCIDDNLYALLDKGRSARNAFIHSAAACCPDDARAVIKAILLLVERITLSEGLSFDVESLMKQLDDCTSNFRSPTPYEPKFWRYPDPAPGFADWGDRQFEKIPEIQLQPIPHKNAKS